MILPIKDIENVSSEHGFKFGYSGLVFIIHGHEDVFFEFSSKMPETIAKVLHNAVWTVLKCKTQL